MPLHLLVIEDRKSDFELLQEQLRRQGLDAACRRVETMEELEAALEEQPAWDAVLTDYNVPGMGFRESVALLRSRRPALPIVLFSGYMGEDQAAELLKSGITDFVLKYRPARLGSAIRRAVEDARAQQARRDAEAAVRESEERLRLALEGAELGMLCFELPAGMCRLDALAQHHFGLGERVGVREMRVRVHPADAADFDAVLGRIAADQSEGRFAAEFRVVGTDGATRWLSLRGMIQPRAAAEPGAGLERIGIVQDVTHYKDR